MKQEATQICLARHGETDWNSARRLQGQEDFPLNATGREQARRAGLYLQQWDWDYLFASPLQRARDSAAFIGHALGLPLHGTLDHFLERDYGAAAGLTHEEIADRFPDGDIPGVEPRPALQARVMTGLNELVEAYPRRRIVVVAHGGVINAALAHISGGEIGSGKTLVANGGLNLLRHDGEAWEIVYYNRHTHLPDAPHAHTPHEPRRSTIDLAARPTR